MTSEELQIAISQLPSNIDKNDLHYFEQKLYNLQARGASTDATRRVSQQIEVMKQILETKYGTA